MASRDSRTRLSKRAAKANVFLTAELSERLLAYYELLTRWNHKINLTAIANLDEAMDRLLLEPIAAVRHLPTVYGPIRQMDVGSGGGSPAIPMKLAVPDMRLTMVEVKARKAAFLREAVRQLGLGGTDVETARYEELLARPELLEAFDVVAVRAVRIESRVLGTLQAFLKIGGSVFLFRGPSGPNSPESIVPPLDWAGTHPLIDSLQSRLTVLTKRGVGAGFVR